MVISFILGLILVFFSLKKNFAKGISIGLLLVGLIFLAFGVYLAL